MKKIISLLLVASLFSCTKQESPTLSGKWTLVGIYAGGTSGSPISTFSPGSKLDIRFDKDGILEVSGPPYTELSIYDRYEIIDDNTVKLISTTYNYTALATFRLEDGLLMLSYIGARCGYEQYFVRSIK